MSDYPRDERVAVELERNRLGQPKEEPEDINKRTLEILASIRDSQEIVQQLCREHQMKFMAGAKRKSFSPFFKYPLHVHVTNLNDEILDAASYMAGIRKGLDELREQLREIQRNIQEEKYTKAGLLLEEAITNIGDTNYL